MWILIAIILVLIFLVKIKRPARKADTSTSKKPIAGRLQDLVDEASNTARGRKIERCKKEYIQIKMLIQLYDDPRFTNLTRAFQNGYTITPPKYIFTEKDHQEAAEYYSRAWWNFGVEFQNKMHLAQFRRAGASHVYILSLNHRQCDAVKKIRKPKEYPIDDVPKIPCAECTEQCGCCYMIAKYEDDL